MILMSTGFTRVPAAAAGADAAIDDDKSVASSAAL